MFHDNILFSIVYLVSVFYISDRSQFNDLPGGFIILCFVFVHLLRFILVYFPVAAVNPSIGGTPIVVRFSLASRNKGQPPSTLAAVHFIHASLAYPTFSGRSAKYAELPAHILMVESTNNSYSRLNWFLDDPVPVHERHTEREEQWDSISRHKVISDQDVT